MNFVILFCLSCAWVCVIYAELLRQAWKGENERDNERKAGHPKA